MAPVAGVLARRVVVLIAAASSLVCGVPAAHAGLLDSSQLTISAPGAGNPHVAVTPGGWTLAAWDGADAKAHAAWRPPGGRFGVPFELGHAGLGSLVATSDDEVVVSMQAFPDGDYAATVTTLDPGATSGPVVTLATNGSGPPALAADAHGHVVAAAGDGGGLRVATRAVGGGFGVTSYVGHDAELPAVATNPAGDVVVGYWDQGAGPMAMIRPAGTTAFLPPEKVPAAGVFGNTLAVTDAGDIAAASYANRLDGGSGTGGAFLALRPAGGTFMGQRLSDRGVIGGLLALPGNRLTVIDEATTDTFGSTLRVTDRAESGALSSPVDVSLAGSCSPSLAQTPQDATVLAYQTGCAPTPENSSIALTERPRGSTFAPSLPLSIGGSSQPAITVNPSGALALAYAYQTIPGQPTSSVIRAVVRDGRAELGVLDPLQVLPVVGDTVEALVGCTGLIDCKGTLELQSLTAGAAAAANKPAARKRVRVRRGHATTLHLRLRGKTLRKATTAKLVVTLENVKGRGARRRVSVVLKPKG